MKSNEHMYLYDPHFDAIVKRTKTHLVLPKCISIEGPINIGDEEFIYGNITLSDPEVIHRADFEKHADKHKTTQEECLKWWPGKRVFRLYKIEEVNVLDKPRALAEIDKLAGMGGTIELDEDTACYVNEIACLTDALNANLGIFIEQLIRLMDPDLDTKKMLQRLAIIADALNIRFKRSNPNSIPASVKEINKFVIINKLHNLLSKLEFTSTAKKSKDLLDLIHDSLNVFEKIAELEDSISEDATLEVCKVHKAHAPKGSLPVLKLPDPEFNIQRLEADKSTGFLSRRKRVEREGERQFLVNEVARTESDASYVWGVITQKHPVEYPDLSEIPKEIREGLDQYTLEEFSTESPVFYIALELVAAYLPPLKLKEPPLGRRFAVAISIPENLAKSALSTLGVPLKGPSSSRLVDFNSITSEDIKTLEASELLALKNYFEYIIAPFVDGSQGGLGKKIKEIEERLKELKVDVSKAGPSSRYAPVLPGSKGRYKALLHSDVIRHFHSEFLIKAPFVYLIGSLCNSGWTKNDIDVLIKGPIDSHMQRVIEFRLGRMLPPNISRRLEFHGGADTALQGDNELSNAIGPFSAYTPLYDLVAKRRDDFRSVIEMRAANIDERFEITYKADPFLTLPAKGDKPYEAVLQNHFRGSSAHGDLRIAANGHLIGYTLAYQLEGEVPKIESLEKAISISDEWNMRGSSWNKSIMNPNRIFVALKGKIPNSWLNVEAEEFEAGTVGATAKEKGYMVAIARPMITWGARSSDFHEYFLEKDKKLFGTLTFRMLEEKSSRKYWVGMLNKNLLPSILRDPSIDINSVPPKEWSFLPPRIKAAVPAKYQYWKADSPQERRDILVELIGQGFFTVDNVKVVDYEIQRVVQKYYLYPTENVDSSETKFTSFKKTTNLTDYAISHQTWKDQAAAHHEFFRDVHHLYIRCGEAVEDFRFSVDPCRSGRSTVIKDVLAPIRVQSFMHFEGEVEPDVELFGVVMNSAKNTLSRMDVVSKGTLRFIENTESFKKFKLDNFGEDIFVLRKEYGTCAIWVFEKQCEVEIDKPTSQQLLLDSNKPFDVVLQNTAKRHETRTVTFSDGQILKNVQVWNPEWTKKDRGKTETSDSTNEDDHKLLRPLALFESMKIPFGDSNEFYSDEQDALFEEFATREFLLNGIYIEPSWGGCRINVQRDANGTTLMTTENIFRNKMEFRNYANVLPNLKKAIEQIKGPFIIDGELASCEGGNLRKNLAFKSKDVMDDSNITMKVFDIYYHPEEGNVMAKPYRERRDLLARFFKNKESKHLELSPYTIAKDLKGVIYGLDWANKFAGSEDVILKIADHTATLSENAMLAKYKMIRSVHGIIWDKTFSKAATKGSDVFNYKFAFGPVSEEEASVWKEVVIVKGQIYVKGGRTFNTSVAADVGDVVRIDITEFSLNAKNPKNKVIRGFSPVVICKVEDSVTRIEEVETLLKEDEIEKIAKSITVNIAKKGSIEDERYVLGVVLIPNAPDAHGDIYSEDEVRSASEYFMEHHNAYGFMHQFGLGDNDIKLLENYLAPQDLEVGDSTITKGTWLMGARIVDDDLWFRIKTGEITGWSIEGSALTEYL